MTTKNSVRQGARSRGRFKVINVADAPNNGFLIFDLSKECLLERETDYADYLIKLNLDAKTIKKHLHDVVEFIEYFDAMGLNLGTFDDADMTRFAQWLLEQAKANKSHRGREEHARKTVNAKLGSVFRWSRWLLVQPNTECLIFTIPTSTEQRDREGANRAHFSGRGIKQSAVRSPAIFDKTGSKKRHSTGFVLEPGQEALLNEQLFGQTQDIHASHRNRLFSKISYEVGLRLGSTNSLNVAQFSREEALGADQILVTPSQQKFSYTNEVVFSSELVMEILDFVRDYRNPLINAKNDGRDLSNGALFLSSRDARPMQNRSFSAVFSQAMRALGAPKGNAVHVLRSYFICAEIEDEIDTRIVMKMDTSDKSIAEAVALKVGHSDHRSLMPYVVLMQQARRNKLRLEKRRKELAVAQELSDLRREVARLKAMVGELPDQS